MKKTFAPLLALLLLFSCVACAKPAGGENTSSVATGAAVSAASSSQAQSMAPEASAPPEKDETSAASSSADWASQPYGEWVGVWESENGTMVIRFSRMADFVLDCYYYYPEDGFGFQINISDDEVNGNYIHSIMLDPAFNYHAEYEFDLDGDNFSFTYHYQFDDGMRIIEESVFARTDETDIQGTWEYLWNL